MVAECPFKLRHTHIPCSVNAVYSRLKMFRPTVHIMQCEVQLDSQSGIFSSRSVHIAVTPDSVTALQH